MPIWLPNHDFEFPVLRSHKKKPQVGRFKVDRQHPLSPDEACIFIGRRTRDVLFGVDLKAVDVSFTTPVIEQRNSAIQFTNASVDCRFPMAKEITHHVAGDLWTISWYGRNNSALTNNTAFCGYFDGNNSDYIQMRNNNSLRLRRGASYAAGTMPAYNEMSWYSLCFTANGYDLYKDGAYQTQYAGSNIPASLKLNNVGCSFDSVDWGFAGALGAFYVHSFGLSPSQIKRLHDKPFQFMIPA